MAMLKPGEPHVHLHPACQLCGDLLLEDEPAVVYCPKARAIGELESKSFLSDCVYKSAGGRQRGVEGDFCTKDTCQQCKGNTETATWHSLCFHAFKTGTPGAYNLTYLHLISTWTSPWHGALGFYLPRSSKSALSLHTPTNISPLDLNYTSRELSSPSPSHRAPTAQQRRNALAVASAQELSTSAQNVIIDRHSTRIMHWQRDGAPVLEHSFWPDLDLWARITLDWRGIKKIERWWGVPLPTPKTDNVVCLVEPLRRLVRTHVYFVFNRYRFRDPVDTVGHDFEETPDGVGTAVFYPAPLCAARTSIRSFEARNNTGLSVLNHDGQTITIRPHTPAQPHLETPRDNIATQHRGSAFAPSVPFPLREHLKATGVRIDPHLDESGKPTGGRSLTFLVQLYLSTPTEGSGTRFERMKLAQSYPLIVYGVYDKGFISTLGFMPNHRDVMVSTSITGDIAAPSNALEANFSCPLNQTVQCNRNFKFQNELEPRGMVIFHQNGRVRMFSARPNEAGQGVQAGIHLWETKQSEKALCSRDGTAQPVIRFTMQGHYRHHRRPEAPHHLDYDDEKCQVQILFVDKKAS